MSERFTCTACGRKGQAGYHRVVQMHPNPDKWFCNNFKACRERAEENKRSAS